MDISLPKSNSSELTRPYSYGVYNFGLRHLVDFALEKSISIEELKRHIDIDVNRMDDARFSLDVHQYDKLIDYVEGATGLTNLGLHVGSLYKLKGLGILGYVMASCKTFGEAVRKYIEYNEITQNVTHFKLDFTGDEVRFYCPPYESSLKKIEEFAMSAVSVAYPVLFQGLTNKWMEPSTVFYSWSEPPNSSAFRKIFQCKVLFDQDYDGISYKRKYHNVPVRFPNAELLPVFESYLQKTLKSLYTKRSFTNKVVRILSLRVNNMPGIDEIASDLNLSSRNLQLKLKAEGTTFVDIRDTVRSQFAKEYLAATNYLSAEIGYLLGFSDSSTFHRAFKRWTGLTPKEYRESIGMISLSDI